MKFLRFFRPEQGHAIATIFGQIAFPPQNVLVFKRTSKFPLLSNTDEGHVSLVATGNVIEVNPNKIVLKRIFLTGYPFRVHKKKAVIRHMFFNQTDIRYFKPVELQTKFGLRGNIRMPLGTHGFMKCVFNNFIRQNDTVCLPLYKRIFPSWFHPTWSFPITGYTSVKIIEEKPEEMEEVEGEEEEDEGEENMTS
jgi:pre-rRNA-processing protein TSR1